MKQRLLIWNDKMPRFSLPNWWYYFVQNLAVDNETDAEDLADRAIRELKTYDAYVEPDFIEDFKSNNKTSQYIIFKTLEGYTEFVLKWHV
jgi:hypothetical protein